MLYASALHVITANLGMTAIPYYAIVGDQQLFWVSWKCLVAGG